MSKTSPTENRLSLSGDKAADLVPAAGLFGLPVVAPFCAIVRAIVDHVPDNSGLRVQHSSFVITPIAGFHLSHSR
ncbi:hypothetical protein [Neorhizobium alkalisoli]|uniref:hypothetical protein n=1 Tax=Neorhizobium alkalisoli TaxID=528178 RepID=UPI001319E106|nr:hypothetical protein [Neorhizobium alkalisoli]